MDPALDGAAPDEVPRDEVPAPKYSYRLVLEVFEDHVVVTELVYGGKRLTGTGRTIHEAMAAWWDANQRELSGHVEG